MRSTGQRILRAAVLVIGLTLLAKASGLLRDIITASQFGTSPELDGFLIAAATAELLFVWLKHPLHVVLVPLFTKDLANRGERAAWENASTLANTMIILFLIFAAMGWLLSPYLVALMAPGFTEGGYALTVSMTKWMMVTVVFLGLARLLSSFFYSYQRFGWPGMISTVDNAVVIPSMLFFTPLLGIYGIVISEILGTISQSVVQLPILWKHRAYYTFRVDLKNPTLRQMTRISLPLFVGTGGAEISRISDRIFASWLSAGSLSALAYGFRLTYTTSYTVVASLTTVLFPFLSRSAGRENYEDLERKLFTSLRALFWIVCPLSIGLLLLHDPLVRLVYYRGAFGEESVRTTGQAVLYYAVGLSAFSLSNVLTYAFYSLQDTKTPVIVGLARLVLKVLLSFALVGPMGHSGLALAESISFMLKAILLLLLLPSALRQAEYQKALCSFGLTGIITGVMAAVVVVALPYVQTAFEVGASVLMTSMGLMTLMALGAVTYIMFSLLLQPSELIGFYRFVRSGFARL